ncbi:MAG: DUF2156 domain-containing protein [Oscillospiraceae bacterium]
MFDFRKIELSDKPWIEKLLAMSDFRGCEYSFANNFAWHRLYETEICRYKDFYISKSEKYGLHFTFPAGQGDRKELFCELRKYSEEKGVPLCVTSVSNDDIAFFEECFPNEFTVSSDEADYDYIYLAEKLRALTGKKYHGKRNHLNRFYENNWSYSPLTEKDFDDCILFAAESYNDNDMYDDESAIGEQFAINTFFNNFEELGLKGGVIRIDGKLAGFTIGSRINSDTLDTHIEKADPSINGAYTAIMNEFAKAESNEFTYINREEDLGIEGLRKSKRSYCPEFQIIKNMVTFK